VKLLPLAEKKISSRVLLTPDGMSLVGGSVTVSYRAQWLCGFLDRWDCGVPQWTVATQQIGSDGILEFGVPDFNTDPAIGARPMVAPFDELGVFLLWVDLGGRRYGLKSGNQAELRVSADYPRMFFEPTRR